MDRIPTTQDVERITAIQDPVMRNLQITQCYHELSATLGGPLGSAANWCTFATWASKQAGQTIRKEDLARMLERRLLRSPNAMTASRSVTAALPARAGNQGALPQNLILNGENFMGAVERASDAVARGNRKVFEEIGYQFARFYADCFHGQQLDTRLVEDFCAGLRDGDPPEGQGLLRRAFSRYAQACGVPDLKTRAELILLANAEIGFHEQTRLQPEIAESLNAGFISFFEFARGLFQALFPSSGWFHLANLYLRRLIGRPTELDRAVQDLLTEVQTQLRQLITETLMTLSLPSGLVRLGEDLTAGFPEHLRQITTPDLRDFLQKHDLTPDSLSGSGARDWADLPQRMHFILDLFRCYQEQADLFDPPFTEDQTAAMNEGKLPPGRL